MTQSYRCNLVPNNARVPVLVVSGTVGVGKSTIVGEIHEILSRANVPHACVDADALALSWPRRGDFNQAAMLENLASFWQNARDAGAQRFVLATVVERREDLLAIRQAIPGAEIVLVQLTAPEAVRFARLQQREVGSGRVWHVQRTTILQRILDNAALHHFAVVNDERPAQEVALDILIRTGWSVAR